MDSKNEHGQVGITVPTFDFSQALTELKRGRRVTNLNWNGKQMFLFMVPSSQFQVSRAPLNVIYPEGTEIKYGAHIDIRMADETICPWTPSQADLFSDLWTLDD